MTFSKLIKHNMKNIFLKKSYTKYFVETSPWKIEIEDVRKSEISHNFTQGMSSTRIPQYIETKVVTTYFYLIKFF